MKKLILFGVVSLASSLAFAQARVTPASCSTEAVAAAYIQAGLDAKYNEKVAEEIKNLKTSEVSVIGTFQGFGIKDIPRLNHDKDGSYYLVQMYYLQRTEDGKPRSSKETKDYKVYVNPQDTECRSRVVPAN